jgi:integrase
VRPKDPKTYPIRDQILCRVSNNWLPPKVVQDMLGHSTITTTMDAYSHVMPAMHGDAVRGAYLGRRHSSP